MDKENRGLIIEDAIHTNPESVILSIADQIYAMGANDSERTRLDDILDELRAGKINGEEAMYQANSILESKMDYH